MTITISCSPTTEWVFPYQAFSPLVSSPTGQWRLYWHYWPQKPVVYECRWCSVWLLTRSCWHNMDGAVWWVILTAEQCIFTFSRLFSLIYPSERARLILLQRLQPPQFLSLWKWFGGGGWCVLFFFLKTFFHCQYHALTAAEDNAVYLRGSLISYNWCLQIL